MFDRNRILAHDDLLDQESHDSLALTNIAGFGIRAQSLQKGREGFREPSVRGPVRRLGIQRLKLALRGLLAFV